MTELWIVFDLLTAAGVLWIGWAALASTDAFRMIVLFMALGLLVALSWARLQAPDVALAEAAVGAGVTGALFLRAWDAIGRRDLVVGEAAGAGQSALLAGLIGAALAAAVVRLPDPGPGLEAAVAGDLAASGVENPVTAVLLNFRAYDTLLEIAVLAVAAIVVLRFARAAGPRPALGPVYLAFARIAVPTTTLVAGYLLWIGAFAPGGAFQAGALLGAAGILLVLGGLYAPDARHMPWARAAFALGLCGFTLAGALALALGGAFLEYPAGAAKAWILSIEALVTVSIGATLVGLFLGGAPSQGGRR